MYGILLMSRPYLLRNPVAFRAVQNLENICSSSETTTRKNTKRRKF